MYVCINVECVRYTVKIGSFIYIIYLADEREREREILINVLINIYEYNKFPKIILTSICTRKTYI